MCQSCSIVVYAVESDEGYHSKRSPHKCSVRANFKQVGYDTNFVILVVSLRQCERQRSREKQRLSENAQTLEEQSQADIKKLQVRLHSIETDRNLLMVSRN